MRLLLVSTAVVLLVGLSPASAMCGGDQKAGGGMCSKPAAARNMSESVEKEWPTTPGKAQSEQPQQKSGMMMCACCKNMAMMDGMKGDDPHKGMDMK